MEVIRAKDSEARRGERFTGTAWVEAVLKAQRPAGMRVFLVFFEPGGPDALARTRGRADFLYFEWKRACSEIG